MIALIGNRPALQVGRHQVTHYDIDWLIDALERAAAAADLPGFPCLDEIGEGVMRYLEHLCPLRMLPVRDLQQRVRRMLEAVGCPAIARRLGAFAPPVTISLLGAAQRGGAGFELAFFEQVRAEVTELRREGAASIHFTDHREAVRLAAGREHWDRTCERLLEELDGLLEALECAALPVAA
jgi:hypothetical protein